MRWLAQDRELWLALAVVSAALAAAVAAAWPELVVSVALLSLFALVLLAAWAVGGGIAAIRRLGLRRALIGGNVVLMSATLIAVAVLLNVLANLATWRVDVTAAERFTLSPTTDEMLTRIEGPIEIVAFFPETAAFRPGRDAARRLLGLYQERHAGLHVRFVDPEFSPAETRRLGVAESGTILFRQGERRVAVDEIDEQAFTEALMQVAGIAAKQVCVLADLGGPDIADDGPAGFSRAAGGLERELFEVRRIGAAAPAEALDDCAVTVIAGARQRPAAALDEALRAYLAEGGALLLLADPGMPFELRRLSASLGLVAGEGQVADPSVHVGDDPLAPAVLAGSYPPSELGLELETTYFPGAAPVRFAGDDPAGDWPTRPIVEADGIVAPVALTSPAGRWQGLGGRVFEGHAALAAMALRRDAAGREHRAVVIGDSDFATNAHIFSGGNGQLLVNAARWLAGTAPLTEIRPKPYAYRRLILDERQTTLFQVASLGVLPGAALLAALFAWWRRR